MQQNWRDCTDCMRRTNRRIRARLCCGWLSESEWGAGEPLPVGFPQPEEGVRHCPGYLVQLPEVIEGSRAHAWAREGSLRDLYDEPLTDSLRDAVDFVRVSVSDVEFHDMRERQRKARRKG